MACGLQRRTIVAPTHRPGAPGGAREREGTCRPHPRFAAHCEGSFRATNRSPAAPSCRRGVLRCRFPSAPSRPGPNTASVLSRSRRGTLQEPLRPLCAETPRRSDTSATTATHEREPAAKSGRFTASGRKACALCGGSAFYPQYSGILSGIRNGIPLASYERKILNNNVHGRHSYRHNNRYYGSISDGAYAPGCGTGGPGRPRGGVGGQGERTCRPAQPDGSALGGRSRSIDELLLLKSH